jgi:Fe-S-cluster containining protein
MIQSVSGMENSAPGSPDRGPVLVPDRSCGTCSLCCKVNPVEELGKPAGQWCVHSVRGGGCADHLNRPAACRQFFCAWRLDAALGPEWKPDVARFVLSTDSLRGAITATVDPGMPLAWKREPYYSRLKQVSESAFRQGRKVLVRVRRQITVVLPDRDVLIGEPPPGEEIVVWREGVNYGAALRRNLATAGPSEKPQIGPSSGLSEIAPGGLGTGPPVEDPGSLDSLFKESVAKTRRLLDESGLSDLEAMTMIMAGRNKVLDETADAYAKAGRAECAAGCVSCCHLMVVGTPFEILSIARLILETRTADEIESLKVRLQRIAAIPLDPAARVGARTSCALLESGRCSVYENRPSVCRMTLSQSRAACDACLRAGAGSIPYIAEPSKIAAVMQMGIDYAIVTRRRLSTEGAELSRALLVALADYQGTLSVWLDGKDPFPGTHIASPGAPSNAERALAAGRRFGLT